MNPPPPRPTRSDALDNRARILAAATEAFSASGSGSAGAPTGASSGGASTSTSMTSIAKSAGVGVGTLYRHFPTRESLIVELYRQEIQKLIDLAHTLAGSLPPLVALRRWFEEVAHYGRLKYGVAEVIHAATNGGLDDEHYDPFLGAITVLLDAGAAEGTLKSGTDPEDVLLQLSVLWRIPPGNGDQERAARILDLVVDGLRTRPPESS
ncbi:TetR family transcriptional regulator [Streptomyces sp. 150FB]|uniref:TetR/AcrR family transcriptional regulator n=1 Tax=Streptomyces sp. 150FB TaxID=1576605 RepID=UPI000589557A|nr:TetR/AcrR family transcriptional regulator [Streptomyces sp. 150FB]KIF79286.1 TetR family transcriptional regulator [Streptomyces sp. 150FB]